MASLEKVVIPKLLGSENYLIWAVRVRAALMRENIDINAQSLAAAANNKALYSIQLLCADGPLLYIKDHTTASAAWARLKELYNPKGFTTEFLVCKEFFSTTLSDFDSMEMFLNKVREIVDQLKSHDIELPSQLLMAYILHSIGDEYKGFISNIVQDLRKDPFAYTMESLFSNLADEARGKEKNSILSVKGRKDKDKSKKSTNKITKNQP